MPVEDEPPTIDQTGMEANRPHGGGDSPRIPMALRRLQDHNKTGEKEAPERPRRRQDSRI